ncbi:MAG: hypothetical protein WBP93_11245 [Pyrinomonadaceae bacterium]
MHEKIEFSLKEKVLEVVQMNPRPFHPFILIFALCSFLPANLAQIQQEKGTSTANQSPLQGMTEAILVDGQPALRILSRKNGSTEILYQKRDGEDALVFPVMHYHAFLYAQAPGEMGKLYVTKTRLIFDPNGDKGHYFNATRGEVKKAEAQKSGRFGKNIGHHILINAQGGEKRFAIVFNNNAVVGFQGDYMKPATEFFEHAWTNFDAALAEFQQLTASVRPESEENAEEEAEETTAEITDKYDRFKDVTVVRTSRMLLRGGRRSIRTSAEYSFAGKTPMKPEKVSLYFHASAARPIFREDDLELNFLVDGERIAAGNMRLSDEEKTKSTVRQTVLVNLPYETFARIANGKRVELQIGTLEYKMTDTHLDAFKQLLARAPQN